MEMHRIKLYKIILCFLLLLSISGCLEKQIVDPSFVKGSTFFKQQSLSQYDKNYAITTLSNDRYLVAKSAGAGDYFNNLKLTYLDEYGTTQNDITNSLGFWIKSVLN